MTTLRAASVPADLAGNGWYESLSPARPFPAPDGDCRADWVIVGAGFAGLSAARRLALLRPQDRIVVLEAQRIAWGAAGRNSGFMIDLPHELQSEDYGGQCEQDRRLIRQNRIAIDFVREAAADFGLCDRLSPIGKLHGAADASGVRALETFSRHLQTLDEPFTTLDADDMRRVTGSAYFQGGLHAPGALLIHPAAYIRGLAAGLADRHRVRIHESTPMLRLETGACHRLHTPTGVVEAPRVILAVNGHVASLGLFGGRLMHVFTFASMTRRLDETEQRRLGGESEWGLIPADPMGSTVRRLRDGRILVRNVFTWNPTLATSAAQVRRIGRRHDASFAARFPMLAGVDMEYRWGGHLCLSRNSAPAFGEVEPGVWVAACQNGLGTTRGTLSGMLAADLACGEESPLLDEWLAEPAPARLPPEPLLGIGARAHLWWVHRRAGRDL